MKYECEVIQDLLPLYKDSACSVASALAVQEHLKECEKCSRILKQLNDTSLDEVIMKEKEDVIGSQSKYFKRRSTILGCIVGGVFALPILISLIVNLASGNGLSWFFIVLAAMMIPASLFVVPLLATKNRVYLTITSLTGSIILLLGVCCLYSGGKWFFMVMSSVLFGMTVFLSPVIAASSPMNKYIGNRKGLAVMAADTVTFFFMIICIGLYASEPGFFTGAFSISIPLICMAWILFLIIRYLPANGAVKTGACIAATSLFSYFGTKVILYLTLRAAGDGAVLVYTEPSVLTMIAGLAIGAALAGIGMLFKGGKKHE